MKTQQFVKELRNKDFQQLARELKETRKKMADVTVKHRLNKLKDYSQIKKLRREISRVLTVLNEKRREQIYGR